MGGVVLKAHVLAEPELEFRFGNRHIDPRYGVAVYGPADADAPTAPGQIPVGLVGAPAAVDGVRRWLQTCRTTIDAKEAKPGQDNLFLPFPGFATDTPFGAELVYDDTLIREIPDRELRKIAKADTATAVRDAAHLYLDAARSITDTGRCRVVICARPDELEEQENREPAQGADEDDESDEVHGVSDFHDLLKARALTLPCPLQLIRSETWSGEPGKGARRRDLQDEATRAWNLHTALYYKAGGTPWRLTRNSTDQATCFVGVSFHRTIDGEELHTAVAQVFNELGDGVVVRGGAAKISKKDKQPHLNEADSKKLLIDALAEFRRVHGHQPARVVLHKSSAFSDAEVGGFRAAVDEKEIDHLELLWIQRRGAPRLFRTGQLPPQRGTTVQLDDSTVLVYTRGSIAYFRTYPGLHVPQPLLIRRATPHTDLGRAAMEVLALSKMNWNNAQLDERDPLTLRTAYRVGSILKHVATHETVATRYAYYM